MKLITSKFPKEVLPVKRFTILVLVAVAVAALTAVPAFAEGYNDGQWNFETGADEAGYGDNAGIYVRTPQNSSQTTSVAGPHGGYTTSTNKCHDCHSTHYAKGDYMLLRANKREDACAFCHGGGGGSTINIQMDNAYDADGPVIDGNRGVGVGHTLGYDGNSPADIDPAYTASEGLACFDCHTPHGNSARVLTTFANPGRAYFEDSSKAGSKNWVKNIESVYAASGVTHTLGGVTFVSVYDVDYGWYFDLNQDSGTSIVVGSTWGLTPIEGNFVIRKATTGALVKPVWPTGRFLLLKNPDNMENGISDDATSGVDPTPRTITDVEYPVAEDGYNKLSIVWDDDPLGPATAAYGGEQDLNGGGFPGAPTGILSVSEFCTDCHDGTAGAAGQPASAWVPSNVDSSTGTYEDVFSHDAQPRH